MYPANSWPTIGPVSRELERPTSRDLCQQASAGPLSPAASPAGAHGVPGPGAPLGGSNSAANSAPAAGGNYPWRGAPPVVLPGLRTGMLEFDKVSGGLDGMTVVAGADGFDCSTLVLNLARGALARNPGLSVLFCS